MGPRLESHSIMHAEHSKPTKQSGAFAAGLWAMAREHRNLVSATTHGVAFAVSLLAAFGLAYNFHGIQTWIGALYLPLLALALPVKLIVFGRMGLFRSSWRYVGLRDLIAICVASQISSFAIILIWWITEAFYRKHTGDFLLNHPEVAFQQSVFLLDWAATIGFVSLTRVAVRSYYEFVRGTDATIGSRVIVVGAGDLGEAVIREILRSPGSAYEIVGILDDDPTHRNHRIHGIDVLGSVDQIREVCEEHNADEVLIAIKNISPKRIRDLVHHCEGLGLRFQTIPAVTDFIEGRVEVSKLRPVDIADLLGREPVTLDTEAIGRELSNKRIVVTGAGGSIGSEMCRQIAPFNPERLILIEQAENNLFEIHRELIRNFPDLDIVPVVADIADSDRIRSVFIREKPHAVFHAAAHKHVPMMEINPGEAVKNNIVGTKTIANAAVEAGVSKMVMISTDKAVNPTSIMGCSKRVAELYVQHFAAGAKTQFVTVRFGNVLGSSGSVIPIFTDQIARGGPVTVTHPDMTRYFMTIPEAAQLVLQAGTMGRGSEIFVLDMGEPVKIVDLAHNMITLSGLRPGEDIEIVFTGTRPGEKLFEELLLDGENVSATSHAKIGIWKSRSENWEALKPKIDRLIAVADSAEGDEIRALLKQIVPEYAPLQVSNDNTQNERVIHTAAAPT